MACSAAWWLLSIVTSCKAFPLQHAQATAIALWTLPAVQVSAIEHNGSAWSVKASPKAGPQAGESLTIPDLQAIVLADIMVTQQGQPCPELAATPLYRLPDQGLAKGIRRNRRCNYAGAHS